VRGAFERICDAYTARNGWLGRRGGARRDVRRAPQRLLVGFPQIGRVT
jgi:hypothetical protein